MTHTRFTRNAMLPTAEPWETGVERVVRRERESPWAAFDRLCDQRRFRAAMICGHALSLAANIWLLVDGGARSPGLALGCAVFNGACLASRLWSNSSARRARGSA